MSEYSRELAAIKMIRNYDDLQTRYDSLMKEAMGLRDVMQGCGDGNCRIRTRRVGGQHTNGGCHCVDNISYVSAAFDRFLGKEGNK